MIPRALAYRKEKKNLTWCASSAAYMYIDRKLKTCNFRNFILAPTLGLVLLIILFAELWVTGLKKYTPLPIYGSNWVSRTMTLSGNPTVFLLPAMRNTGEVRPQQTRYEADPWTFGNQCRQGGRKGLAAYRDYGGPGFETAFFGCAGSRPGFDAAYNLVGRQVDNSDTSRSEEWTFACREPCLRDSPSWKWHSHNQQRSNISAQTSGSGIPGPVACVLQWDTSHSGGNRGNIIICFCLVGRLTNHRRREFYIRGGFAEAKSYKKPRISRQQAWATHTLRWAAYRTWSCSFFGGARKYGYRRLRSIPLCGKQLPTSPPSCLRDLPST